MLRGGSWINNDPDNLVSSYRNSNTPDNRNHDIEKSVPAQPNPRSRIGERTRLACRGPRPRGTLQGGWNVPSSESAVQKPLIYAHPRDWTGSIRRWSHPSGESFR